MATDHVLNDIVLEKVAHHAWAKELTDKFAKPYMTKWTCEQSVKMYHIKPEDREDDTFLTPRSNQSKSERFSASSGTKLLADKGNVTKFDHYVKNADNVLFQRDYEENEPVSFKFRI